MNDSKTPKIVVGVGLVAAYGAIALYLMRDKPVSAVVEDSTTASTATMAGDAFPTPAIASPVDDLASSVDLEPGVNEQPAIATEQPAAATPSPSPAARPAAARPATNTAVAPAPRPQVREQARAGEQPDAPGLPAEVASVDESGEAAEPEVPAQVVSAPAGNDSQITADVKAEIAAVAPAGTIDVSTTDGVVELTGSVPSQEEVEKVRMAAQSVPDVRSVDVSALMVSTN